MDEGGLVRTFDMLIDRLGKVEESMCRVISGLEHRDEISSEECGIAFSGMLQSGLPVIVSKFYKDYELHSENALVVELNWQDRAGFDSMCPYDFAQSAHDWFLGISSPSSQLWESALSGVLGKEKSESFRHSPIEFHGDEHFSIPDIVTDQGVSDGSLFMWKTMWQYLVGSPLIDTVYGADRDELYLMFNASGFRGKSFGDVLRTFTDAMRNLQVSCSLRRIKFDIVPSTRNHLKRVFIPLLKGDTMDAKKYWCEEFSITEQVSF